VAGLLLGGKRLRLGLPELPLPLPALMLLVLPPLAWQ
jgi:hypothetical protein